jgi:hypothetical protein
MRNIISLLNSITEEYLDTLVSKHREGKTFDIYKNPSSNEFHDFIRSNMKGMGFPSLNEFNIRFIIDIGKRNFYIWNAEYALHIDIFRHLGDKLSDSYIGGNIDTVHRQAGAKRTVVFDPYSSSVKYKPLDLIYATRSKFSRFLNMRDFVYEIGYEKYTFDDDKLINLKEEYSATVRGSFGNTDIYKDSPSSEIARLLKSSELGSLRFVMNHREDYIVFDSTALHHDVVNGKSAPSFDKNDLKGQIFSDKLYVYQHSAYIFFLGLEKGKYSDNIPQNADGLCVKEIEKTVLYSNLKRVGIKAIEIGKWM